jgi:hypothetical protein
MALGLDQLELDQLDPLSLPNSLVPSEDGIGVPLLDLLGLINSLIDEEGGQVPSIPDLVGSNESGGLVIGDTTLGVETTSEQGQPGGSTDPVIEIGSPTTVTAFDDAGHDRIETIAVHGIVTEANVTFAGGESTYQPQPGDGDLANVSVMNGLDGNNLESIEVDGPVQVAALWDNTNAGSGTQTSVGDTSNLADGAAMNGIGGGEFDSLTVGAPIIGLEPITVQNDITGDSNPGAVIDSDVLFAGVLDGPNSDNMLDSVDGIAPPDVGVPDLGGVQDIASVPTIDTGLLGDLLA